MPKTPFRRAVSRVLSPILSFPEIRHALPMTGYAFIPTIGVFFVFEWFLTDKAIAQLCRIEPAAVSGHDFAPLFNYYIAWVAHVLISVGVGVDAAHSAFRDISVIKKTVLMRFHDQATDDRRAETETAVPAVRGPIFSG